MIAAAAASTIHTTAWGTGWTSPLRNFFTLTRDHPCMPRITTTTIASLTCNQAP